MRLLLIIFFLEAGFALIVVPWSEFWDRNYFAQAVPQLEAVITNNFTRGAVSGLGVVNIALGITELVALVLSRRVEQPVVSIRPSRAAEE